METDAARLNTVFLTIRKSLLAGVVRIVRDGAIAEELTQEAYLRAYRALASSAPRNLEAFLWQTARNLALDHLRRNRVRATLLEADLGGEALEAVADNRPSAEEEAIRKDDMRAVTAALETLPPRARTVWVLSRVEGWPYPKIAAHLGVSPNTVFNDIKMAMGLLHDLRRRLDRDG